MLLVGSVPQETHIQKQRRGKVVHRTIARKEVSRFPQIVLFLVDLKATKRVGDISNQAGSHETR